MYTDAYLRGQDELQKRLLPGLTALIRAALDNLTPDGSDYARGLRKLDENRIKWFLERMSFPYAILRDVLATLTWRECACRNEARVEGQLGTRDTYEPRGVVDVAQMWAIWGVR